jgi:nitrogen fixation/metabolism regulation signal transduction histidine kinase
MTMDNRRKKLLVNPIQQRRFVMGAVLTGIILINLTVILTVIFNPLLLEAVEINHLMFLAGVEIVAVFGIAYFSLILSHKIAGPAYALARDLKRLADGDLTVEIRLREGDFNMEAAEALNFTAEILRTRMKAIKAELAKLEARRNIDEDTRRTVERLLHDVAYFKTEPNVNSDPQSNKIFITTGPPSGELLKDA